MIINCKNILDKLAGYDFDIGDEVRLKDDATDHGVIINRTFPFDKFAAQLLPGRYYSVMLQENYIVDGKKRIVNIAKLSCRQGHLEKLNSDEGGN